MVTFSYQLHGRDWAYASIADGADQLDMRVSYLSDALRDLTEATISLLLGVEAVSFTWQDEPGGYFWHIQRLNGDATIRVTARSRYKKADQEFNTVCLLYHFAHQVLQQLWTIFHELGPDEYRNRWHLHEFPLAQYRRLESLLRKPDHPLR